MPPAIPIMLTAWKEFACCTLLGTLPAFSGDYWSSEPNDFNRDRDCDDQLVAQASRKKDEGQESSRNANLHQDSDREDDHSRRGTKRYHQQR